MVLYGYTFLSCLVVINKVSDCVFLGGLVGDRSLAIDYVTLKVQL